MYPIATGVLATPIELTIFSIFATAEHACSTDPCHNGASCIDVAGGFVCNCLPGWTGHYCNASKNCYVINVFNND